MRKPYFKPVPGSPAPLRAVVKRQVRFEEVDPMGIVWHGRYAGYFEDSRVALGHKYGISYSDFIRQRTPAPVRQMCIEYLAPLFFEDDMEIEAILHWSEAARMGFEYRIRKEQRYRYNMDKKRVRAESGFPEETHQGIGNNDSKDYKDPHNSQADQ